MGYRDLEEERVRAATAKAMYMMLGTLAALWGFGLIYVIVGLGSNDKPTVSTMTDDVTVVTVSFGLSRSSVTRSAMVLLKPATPTTPAPTTATVRLRADLQNIDSPAQFPSSQIIVGGNLLTENSVLLSIAIDPWSPERVPAGTYKGDLVLTGSGPPQYVTLVISLRDRDGGWAAVAASVLLVGALLGLIVKWVTEHLTPQAPVWRRLTSLRRAVGWNLDGRSLPLTLRQRMDKLAEDVAQGDYTKTNAGFEELEKDREQAAIATSQIDALYELLDEQVRIIKAERPRGDNLIRADAALNEEYRRVLEIQTKDWKGTSAARTTQMADELRAHLIIAGQVILAFAKNSADPALSRAMDELQAGNYETAADLYRSRLIADGPAPTAANRLVGVSKRLSEYWKQKRYGATASLGRYTKPSVPFWQRHARKIAAFASAIVVTLVGLKSQYLDDQAFPGMLASWMTLGLWGLAVSLSGVSILDVLSRLSITPTSPAGRPTNIDTASQQATEPK